jgi:hypothetical protein
MILFALRGAEAPLFHGTAEPLPFPTPASPKTPSTADTLLLNPWRTAFDVAGSFLR